MCCACWVSILPKYVVYIYMYFDSAFPWHQVAEDLLRVVSIRFSGLHLQIFILQHLAYLVYPTMSSMGSWELKLLLTHLAYVGHPQRAYESQLLVYQTHQVSLNRAHSPQLSLTFAACISGPLTLSRLPLLAPYIFMGLTAYNCSFTPHFPSWGNGPLLCFPCPFKGAHGQDFCVSFTYVFQEETSRNITL